MRKMNINAAAGGVKAVGEIALLDFSATTRPA